MTSCAYISILTLSFCLSIATTSCGRSHKKKTDQGIKDKSIQIDTSETAIITFDKKRNYSFDPSYMQATLTQDDISSIDRLLIACVTDYNNSLDEEHKGWSIDLKQNHYRKQLIAVTNSKGEKEVWVNCFCDTWGNNNWKTSILLVHDGGNCYFNFKINLATKKFYNLRVNGEA